jgi:hypothetical protein
MISIPATYLLVFFLVSLILILAAWFGGSYTSRQSYKHVTDAHAELLTRFSSLQDKYINLSEEHGRLKAKLDVALQEIDRLSAEMAALRRGDCE